MRIVQLLSLSGWYIAAIWSYFFLILAICVLWLVLFHWVQLTEGICWQRKKVALHWDWHLSQKLHSRGKPPKSIGIQFRRWIRTCETAVPSRATKGLLFFLLLRDSLQSPLKLAGSSHAPWIGLYTWDLLSRDSLQEWDMTCVCGWECAHTHLWAWVCMRTVHTSEWTWIWEPDHSSNLARESSTLQLISKP